MERFTWVIIIGMIDQGNQIEGHFFLEDTLAWVLLLSMTKFMTLKDSTEGSFYME